MNATGAKGGAFGFRVSSINKVCCSGLQNCLFRLIMPLQLVDTKSLHNTTLLHFLERTVSKYFPDMETFLDELDRPAEAYKGDDPCCFCLDIYLSRFQSTCKIYAKGSQSSGKACPRYALN